MPIVSLLKRISAISNPNRRRIYFICLKEKLNILELSKKIGLSYNSTFENVNTLEEADFVSKEKVSTGSEAIIVSNNNLPTLIQEIVNTIEKENPSKSHS